MRSSQKPTLFQPAPVKHATQYDFVKWHESSGISLTKLLTKRKDQSRWYVKQNPNGESFPYEVVASEFARLLIPGQPKTRLMTDDIDQQYIASREVDAYVCFEDMHNDTLSQGLIDHTYYGLGWVCVVALLTNEYDLNLGNVGINKHHQVIKIDGGHAFIQCHPSDIGMRIIMVKQEITADLIKQLPFATSYGASNWLHTIRKNKMRPCEYSNQLQGDPVFRREVHQAILRALILPPALIETFVHSYCADDADMAAVLRRELQDRLVQLKASVACDDDFKCYLLSEAAVNDLEVYVGYLETFHTTSKQSLMVNARLDKAKIMQQFENLRTYLPTSGLTVTQVDITQFVFTTVEEVIHVLPMMAKRYWQELGFIDERKPVMVICFLEAFTRFLQFYPICEEEADRIVNAAYLHNICCFYSIYKSLSSALKPSEDKLLALGFYKKFFNLFKKIPGSSGQRIVKAAEKFALLYDQYGHMLYGEGVFDFTKQRILVCLGSMIDWELDLSVVRLLCELYALLDSIAEKTFIALMLVRLGIVGNHYILDSVPLASLREQLRHYAPFYIYTEAFDGEEGKASEYFSVHVYYEQIRRRIGKIKLVRPCENLTRSDIECFIQSNRFALAAGNIEPQASRLLLQYMNAWLICDPQTARCFIRDFYLNPDYQYGLYALHKARAEIMPEGGSKFVPFGDDDEFKSFAIEGDYYGSPYMSLLVRQVPVCLSCEEFFRIIDLHFAVDKMPLNIFIKMSLFADKFTGNNAGDALTEISNASYLKPDIRADLQMATIMAGHVTHCPLSFDDLCVLFVKFIDSRHIKNSTAYFDFIRLIRMALVDVNMITDKKYGSLIAMLKRQLKVDHGNEQSESEIEMLEGIFGRHCLRKPDQTNEALMEAIQGLLNEFESKYQPVKEIPRYRPRM